MTPHALTVDLEDWHQLLHRRVTGELIPPGSAVVDATSRLLDALDEAGVRATFFVLGYVADVHSGLVREIARRGHEIGSHTFAHRLIRDTDRAAFRADVERSRKQLQDLTGQPILGFRAPEFSVPSLDHWSFAVLAEAGFAYDSSVFPIAGARYGLPDAPDHPFPIATASGPIQEFPLATWALGRRRVPVAGGTYFRLWPGVILRRALAEIDRGGGTAVLYVHPYEFSADRLFLTGLTWRQRLDPAYLKYAILHNLFTGAILRRLAPILRQYEFRPLEEICGAISHQPLAVGHQMPPDDKRLTANG